MLTQREREILLLLAKGLTNAEIADQAVIYAYENGLVREPPMTRSGVEG